MSPRQHLADDELQRTVLAELEWISGVDSTRIGVAVSAGTVTLFGEVETFHEKRVAAEAAMSVVGVRALAQEIVVRSPFDVPTDVSIAREAQAALDDAADVPVQVRAVVQDRFLTLSGEVGREFERRAAEGAVRDLPGVLGLLNLVTTVPGGPEQQIRAALGRSAEVDDDSVGVAVDRDGVVTLSGWVRTPTERAVVTGASWSASGVDTVLDLMQDRP